VAPVQSRPVLPDEDGTNHRRDQSPVLQHETDQQKGSDQLPQQPHAGQRTTAGRHWTVS
jgi:hypothetical protein